MHSYQLSDGSRVAVMGGAVAGAMFSYFFLEIAERIGLQVSVDIYEPRDFSSRGPRGCNMCGGIISETLVQSLAAEGIILPSDVVQRGIEAYVLHTDAGTVRIETPVNEKRIGAVHRGGGPMKAPLGQWRSFDGFLLSLATKKGARVVPTSVEGVTWDGGRPTLQTREGLSEPYDLLVVATGVNTSALKLFDGKLDSYHAPTITRTMIREYYLGAEKMQQTIGDAMHLFLFNLSRLKFAAIIPKGECATLCMLGEEIDRPLLESFLAYPQVERCIGGAPEMCEKCGCSPRMAIGAAPRPYGDRIVFIGDTGVTRLYKDGIGAAYRTAKAAATTAVFRGVASRDFEKYFQPVCRTIATDNGYGKVIFLVTKGIQKFRIAQHAVLAMVAREQENQAGPKRMSSILWDTFTGSAPYKNIFYRTLHPVFLGLLLLHLLKALGGRPSHRRSADVASSTS